VFELFRQYFRIAVLAGRPQELPGGATQMQVGVAVAVVTYLAALGSFHGLGRAVTHVVLDLGFTALTLRVALSLVGHPGRFEQAFGGLCGASAVINLAAVPVYLSRPTGPGGEVSANGALAEFALLVWSLTLLAHVVRHTFEVRLVTSVGIAFLWLIVLVGIMEAMLPSAASGPALDAAPESVSLEPGSRLAAADVSEEKSRRILVI